MEPIEITDGRFLLGTAFSGRGRLLVGKPDGEFAPLLDTVEETSSPAISLSNGDVGFVLGSGKDQMIAIASSEDGRLGSPRSPAPKDDVSADSALSPDSGTLYFGTDGFIWAISAADGACQKLLPATT